MKKIVISAALGILVLFVAIQLIPYGHDHTNPSVAAEPNWNSPETRALAQRACYDCHSNQTVWPWYSNIAPISWLTVHDVQAGRQRLNFSQWSTQQRGARDAAREVQRGNMPVAIYTLMHPSANLTAAEKQTLISGFGASLVMR